MTDRYVDVNSQNNLHADKNMTTKDFENLGVYGKSRSNQPQRLSNIFLIKHENYSKTC